MADREKEGIGRSYRYPEHSEGGCGHFSQGSTASGQVRCGSEGSRTLSNSI